MLVLFLALAPSLKQMDDPSSNDIRLLIESLASEDVDEREKSSAELRRLGECALAPLENARQHTDPEVVGRAGDLCQAIAFDQLKSAEVDLHTLTVAVGQVAQKEILWTEDLGLRNHRITIVSDVPLRGRPEILFKVYQAVLRIHDLILIPVDEKRENDYRIRPCPVGGPGAGRTPVHKDTIFPEEHFISRVYSLQKASSSEVQAALINIASFPHHILRVDPGNLLLTVEYEFNVRRFDGVVKFLDRPNR